MLRILAHRDIVYSIHTVVHRQH